MVQLLDKSKKSLIYVSNTYNSFYINPPNSPPTWKSTFPILFIPAKIMTVSDNCSGSADIQ